MGGGAAQSGGGELKVGGGVKFWGGSYLFFYDVHPDANFGAFYGNFSKKNACGELFRHMGCMVMDIQYNMFAVVDDIMI